MVAAFEKYFGKDMQPNAIESLSLVKGSKEHGSYFYSKIVDQSKPKDENDINKALVKINPETKEIENISIYYTIDFEKSKNQEVETEKGKKLAEDFIKEHKLVENIDEIEYLGEFRMGPLSASMIYKYGENKAIRIVIASTAKPKVSGFYYIDGEQANEYVNYRDYIETGEIG